MDNISNIDKRRRRVNRLKHMIVGGILVLIAVPIAICILLACKLYSRNNDFFEMMAQYEAQLSLTDELSKALEYKEQELDAAQAELSEAAVAINVEVSEEEEEIVINEDNKRKVYLTFDDGPSIYTEQILDILDSYGVNATFFVTGTAAEEHPDRCRMIVERGNTLAMHSYSHIYREIYRDEESFINDLNRVRGILTDITGTTPVIYRFPGGSSNTVSATDMNKLCAYLEDNGITYFDWNVSSGDASRMTLSTERIIANCMAGIVNQESAVVLLHDTSAKYTTVAALPGLIEQIMSLEDTEILPITNETEAIQHRESKETN